MSVDSSIDKHYGFGGIADLILKRLEEAGKDLNALTVDDLAPVDEFHTRGREGTLELAALAALAKEDHLLDVGCGLGGSARHLSHEYSCSVVGIDLTEEYIDVAKHLTSLVGMDGSVEYRTESALELSFSDSTFDVAWTEHAQMNIANKGQFYAEIARVLKPGGRFVFHDIFRGEGADAVFPVPWAEEEEISFLAPIPEIKRVIDNAGLAIERWEDKSRESITFFEKVIARVKESGPPPLGIHLLMGVNAKEKLENYLVNLSQGRTAVAMGLAVKQ